MTRLGWIGGAVVLLGASSGPGAEIGQGRVYAVVELHFVGPHQTARQAPARDIDLRVTFRHESGKPEVTVYGFWDGDGQGGVAGKRFAVRFCPTKPGRWELVRVESNVKELHGQHQGDHVVAVASQHPGFWEVDAEHAGGRWYRRSNGSHPYIIGNTHYSFLSGYRDTGVRADFDIAREVTHNARYFKKLRFGLTGDRYPHPTEKPFFDDNGQPTEAGSHSVRPNPRWFQQRVDVAVRAAYDADLIADLILCGPDTADSRSTLRSDMADVKAWLKYIAARYGSFPNVWICLCNEYDIKSPKYTNAEIVQFGQILRGYLPYPTPLSVHASPYPYGNRRDPQVKNPPAWSAELDRTPPWNDHQILQRKLRRIAPAADIIQWTYDNPGGQPRSRPTINDELSYQGDGDKHSEADTLAAHLGAFLGGGYGSTGYKTAEKKGHYFWGGFNPEEHTAAVGLKFLREVIDQKITFWKMVPDTSIFPHLDAAFRGLAWPGHEYVLGTDQAAAGLVARLPEGTWTVTRYDLISRQAEVLTHKAMGQFRFDAPDRRAVLFHFRKNADKPMPPSK
ncbi:MAG: DUF5060 domain-containing protein [Gemmataceae bacterium]|nr:DUF5060 domain-containing protein [Gemmata sp.]MDW8199333.1 DUF5060 domain-containing protein [Gemmataceae bacterium]